MNHLLDDQSSISNLRHPCVVRIGKLREKLIAALREEELQPGMLQLLILKMGSYTNCYIYNQI